MLQFIRIRDFALIHQLEIEFGEGLNLLTGETGSGKSILVDAFSLLVGERASQESVRSGCQLAVLEGVFSLGASEALSGILNEAGIDADDDLVLIRREISSTGRNRVFVNNNLATLALLNAMGDHLADIHGQHDHQALLQVETHLEFLDRFGGNARAVERLRERYGRIRRMAKDLESMRMDEQERLKKIDLLEYQIREIHNAHLQPQEKEELENEKRLLANREKLLALATGLYSLVYESEASVLSQLNRVSRNLRELSSFDPRWASHREALDDAVYRLEDLAYFSRDYLGGIDFSPERLDQIERRLAELDRLVRKYGHSVSEILEYAERCGEELQHLISQADRSGKLETELDAELKQYMAEAEALSEKRRRDARRLEREIQKEFKALSMEKMELTVQFRRRECADGGGHIPSSCGPAGIDQVEFLVTPNPGEERKPLAKIASGGELSRIMLSLKSQCGADDSGKTLVFDEVDVGIGGRVAEAVGRRLRDISRNNQVLCVTHLPQIAAYAHRHYRVRKELSDSRTQTFVELLNDSERVKELARMLAGETITETSRRHAREMLTHSSNPAREK